MQPKYAERVLQRIGDHVTQSELVPIELADESCRNPCGHIGVKHEDCWPYTLVSCSVCDQGLGVA